MTKFKMAELTGGEARALYAENPVILLPMGSYEDQGVHAPMGDFLHAERISELIAQQATENGVRTVVAPVLPFGGNDFFGSMPGGIALSPATFATVTRDMLDCLLRHNLTRLVIMNGHSGNVHPIQAVTQEIYRDKGILVPSLYLWHAAHRLLPQVLGPDRARLSAGHGADPLTSIALNLFPHLVRTDMIPSPSAAPEVIGLPVSGFASVSFEGIDIAIPVESDEIAPEGIFGGDARLSSAETGAALVGRLVDIGASFVQHFASQRQSRAKS
ncbi:creatininase family protein [Rhizobium leguminosarum]|uniref:creatininase family protein n=1 Tax=Rhizobium leguminosarum TaxID=384 RepID=UPI001C93CD0E|nr:creatininase family protein [Rhizobium leguminosarum]